MLRTFASRLFTLLLAFGLTSSALAQQNDVQIETIPVSENVYMLIGQGGNIGVSIGDDGVFIIDDQFAPMTDKINAAIAELSDQPVRFVINTHWHGDHTGGNENYGKAGAVIVAHDNVRKRMSTDQVMEAFGRNVPASPAAALPVVTFGEDVSLHLNGDEMRAVHVANAHTDGDAIMHFKGANVIHMGDTFFAGRFPFIDRGSGGSIDGMIAASNLVLSLSDESTKIIPGHGPLCTPDDLKEYRDMMLKVRSKVAMMVREDKTLEEVQAAKPAADYESWGEGFIGMDRFVSFVYESLTEQ